MSVPVPVPENLLSIVTRLLTLAETEPLVADTVLPILESAFDFALTSGKVTHADVWIRAFEAATAEIASKKLADTWLTQLPVK